MKRVELKVARIGNSRGVRIPAATLERYRIGESVVMEERNEGILLRPRGTANAKLSWAATAEAMAAAGEDWTEWDSTAADGLESTAWDAKATSRVSEQQPKYPRRRKKKK